MPENNADETQPARTVTVAELDALVDALFKQKQKIKGMEALVAAEVKTMSAMETKIGKWLDELGRSDYQHPSGSLYFQEGFRFKLPEGDENKQLFFEELKKRNLFDHYATVNANSYNAYLNAEWDAAKKEGRGMNFTYPGVPQPDFYKVLRTRKSSKGSENE